MKKMTDVKYAIKYLGDKKKGNVLELIDNIGDLFFEMFKNNNFIKIEDDKWTITSLGEEFYESHCKKISLFDKIRFKINEFINKF